MNISEEIAALALLPVVKIDNAADSVPLCRALCAGGLPAAEITFRTEAAEEAIKQATAAFPDMLIGAGTVTDIVQADRAVAVGAKFIVTPGFNPKVVRHCIDHGYPIFPGCPTSSDIEAAREMGLRVVKFFPAESMGGIKTIKALSAPYPDMKFIPTGGINEENVRSYMAASIILACGGSWMVPGALIKEGKFDEIKLLTEKAIKAVHGFRIVKLETAAVKPIGVPALDGIFSNAEESTLTLGVNSVKRAEAYLMALGAKYDVSAHEIAEKVNGYRIRFVEDNL